MDQYNVFSRRRWNYESNCAAIVCYASTGLATSTTQLTDLTDDIINRHCRLARALTAAHIDQILTYTLNRILKGHHSAGSATAATMAAATTAAAATAANTTTTTTNNTAITITTTSKSPPHGDNNQSQQQQHVKPVIHFKIFYQVNAAPPIDLLIQSINEFREKTSGVARFAYTVLPAVSLQNFSTFLSICGIKHE